ncbi:MAG: ATP-binding cassette domain-containing protein [Taibaiella sp.]|nr:ATP-binding cassette domain-containing protein [Taibaiella sp.]
MLRFTEFRKDYGAGVVIAILALELEQGIYWLKGENGSGKTTLIKSIAGLMPFEGEIAVAGISIKKEQTAYRAIVNYAEAEPLYPAFIPGSELVDFYRRMKKAESKAVSRLVDALGIGGFMANNTGTYSSGMAKKLSLVLGFIGNPKLVLLDEPLITLDQQSVANLQQLVGEYLNLGVSFLVTSHQEVTFGPHTHTRLVVTDKTLSKT